MDAAEPTPEFLRILHRLCHAAAEKFPQAWTTFFQFAKASQEQRRSAFTVLIGYINSHLPALAPKLCEQSILHRQRTILLALICFLPREQFDDFDLNRLSDG